MRSNDQALLDAVHECDHRIPAAISRLKKRMSQYNRITLFCLLGIFIGLSGFVGLGFAQTLQDPISMEPDLARFSDGDQSLQRLIEFPDVDGDVLVVVYCRAFILEDGQVYSNTCFPTEGVRQSFPRAIENAMRSALVTPAVVDGAARAVPLFYRVGFLRKDGEAEIAVYSNWGIDMDEFGLDYEAPQRYTSQIFPMGCADYWWSMAVTATMVIGADGALAGDVRLESSELTPMRRCTRSLKRFYEKSKYIPGRHDGKPIEATLVEVWGPHEHLRFKDGHKHAD